MRGEVIRKVKATPRLTPDLRKPIKKGIEEQEQKGVMAPNREAIK
jgi:hypothetical protein